MTGDKWDALRDSLLQLFENIANDGDSDVQVGLVTFDDQTLDQISPAALSQSQRTALESAIDRPVPHGGGTGTLNALDHAYDIANRVNGVRRVLVLFSDGAPSRGSVEQQQCEERVRQETRDRDSKLFSVGIGVFDAATPSSYDPAFMGRLAVAGGTAPRGCDPATTPLSNTCHFQVTPGSDPTLLQKQFTAALDAIRTAVICP
jgi:hypothetical protein